MAIGVAAAGVALSGIGMIQANNARKEARRGADETQARIDARQAKADEYIANLKNPYAGLTISTYGSDLQNNANNLALATNANAIMNMGSRGAAALSGVASQHANVSNQIAAGLDAQQKDLDMRTAGAEMQLDQVKAGQLNNMGSLYNEANGWASLYAAGQADYNQNLKGLYSSLATGVDAYQNSGSANNGLGFYSTPYMSSNFNSYNSAMGNLPTSNGIGLTNPYA